MATPMKVTVREDSDPDTEEDEAEESRWRSRMTLQRMRSTGTPEVGSGEAPVRSKLRGSLSRVVRAARRVPAAQSLASSQASSPNHRDGGPSPGSPTSFSSRSPFAEEAASAERPKPHKTFTRLRTTARLNSPFGKTGSKRSKTEVFGRNVARFADEEISPRSAMRRAGTSRRLTPKHDNRAPPGRQVGNPRLSHDGGAGRRAHQAIEALEQAKALVKSAGLRQWSIKHRDGTTEEFDAGAAANTKQTQSNLRKTTKALAEESLEQGPKLTAKRSKWAGIRKMLGVAMGSRPSRTLADVIDDPGDLEVSYLIGSDSESEGGRSREGGAGSSDDDIPETKVRGDAEMWLYRKFGKVWEGSLRMLDRLERLTPGDRGLSAKVQAALASAKLATKVPIHIQLLEIGGDSDERTTSSLDNQQQPWQTLSTPQSPVQSASMLNEELLQDRHIYFHLLSTFDRQAAEASSVGRDEYVDVIVNGERQRTQIKLAAVHPSWGETFVYSPDALRDGDWIILVQVWDTRGRFYGDAEIDLRAYMTSVQSDAAAAVVHSASLYANNRAGRQVTGRVRFALWSCAAAWWNVSWGNRLPPAVAPAAPSVTAPPTTEGEVPAGQPTCSTSLPAHLPRPLPAVVHLPNAVLYEEPLITFLYIKFIKLRARKGPAAAGRRGERWMPALSATNSLRARRLVGRATTAFERTRTKPGHGRTGSIDSYEGTTISASDLEDWDVESTRHGESEAALPRGRGSKGATGSGRDGAVLAASAAEEQKFEFKVSFRGIERRHRFRALPDLSDFAILDAAMYFPIRDHLHEGEVLLITVKRGRRLVVETSITVQAIVSSCARLGNQKEDEIWWNLDGKWPGSGSASGEVLLNYGVSNCDHRGGIASTDTTPAPAPDGSGRALHKLNSVPRGRGSMPPSRLSSIQSRAHRLSRSFAVTANNRMSTAFGSMLGGPLPFGLPEAVAASQEVPKEGEERGPLGYCKIVLHGLRLAVPQEHICILRCSNYWVRTSPARTREGGSSWRDVVVVLPLWRPSEHIVLAAFSTSGGLRSTVNMIGKLRFRISSLRAGQQLMHGRFPLSSDVGGKPGFAVMSVEWTYTSISSVLQSYFKPTHPDPMFELGIPAMVKDMEKEVNQISIEWLDSCAHPPIPLAVTSKALATSRDNFELKTAQANVRRIMHIIGNIKAIAAAWGRLQRWENQLHSALALIGVVLFVFYPALVVAGVCLGIGVTSMSQSRADANAARAGGEAGEAGEREAGEAAARAADKEDDSPPSIREKYNRLIENALMVQNIMDDIACGAERLQSLTNWHDPTSTLLVCTLLFAAAPLLCLLGLRVVALFGLAWQLRPPRLRDPRTPPPVVFFSHLPTVGHSLAAADVQAVAA